ncbi:MAG: prolyl aminopeptidase [Chloracidobacterium sp. CP2_5A]|nr:MAG: prolyl aminopeptidase [Chloracidobacterium sp. CP2_5A]
MTDARPLYPPIEPYETGMLPVSARHTLYYEVSGNPQGRPAVFLHGGPGGGTSPDHRRYFDPERYRIVLFDQRGAGKSVPYACLEENTTWDLVADIERLRQHLGIEKWLVFGGSWGSTLALAYAETHPDRARALVLRGIFLCRKKEIDWFYQEGANAVFPDAWEPYWNFIPPEERHDMVAAYYRRLTSDDEETRLAAARAWSVWEGSASKLLPDPDLIKDFDDRALAIARIECHYFINRIFMESEHYLLEHVRRIRQIPTVIVQGRYDMVCPMMSAWALHKAFPEADLQIIPNAGHSASEPGTMAALVAATDRFALLPD